MAQHFLLSPAARTLTLAQVARMTDQQVETMFRAIRWVETEGEPVCPFCGVLEAYECRRPNGGLRFRCKGCGADFTLTSNTLFHSHKLPLRSYLMVIAVFCNEVKGKNALAMSRDIGLSYKTSFVICHKLREAMAEEMKDARVGGKGVVAEVDGAYFGGYVKPANMKEHRIDRRLSENQRGKRRVVVAVRERGGRIISTVAKTESAGISFIRERVAKGTVLHADEAGAWNTLHARYTMHRINHQEAYRKDGACTNNVESFFSRIRRAEQGHHHHIAGPYLHRYAQEAAFREDHRRDSNGEQVRSTISLALAAKPSRSFCGYWQRHNARQ